MTFGTHATVTKIGRLDLRVEDSQIEHVDKFKYLGMILDPLLSFKDHVSYVRSKVVPRLKMLDKLRHVLTKATKLTLFKTLITPLFDYGDILYEGLSQVDSSSLQKLQNSGLRRILNCDPWAHIIDMHQSLNLDELIVRRRKHLNSQVYKCIHELALTAICDIIKTRQPSHIMTTRSVAMEDLLIPRINLDVCRRNFKYKGPVQWQLLPANVKSAPSLATFKKYQNTLNADFFQ